MIYLLMSLIYTLVILEQTPVAHVDSLKLRIENATEESEKKGLKQELESHQTLAKTGYETFSYDQKLSKESWKAVQTHPQQ